MFWLSTVATAACLVFEGAVFDGDTTRTTQVLVRDATVVSIGADAGAGQAGCTRVQVPADGLLTPGFVDSHASVGVEEVGMASGTVDHTGSGDPIRASLRVTEAYNPASVHVAIWRKEGLTGAVLVPQGGLVSGQAGWVRMRGATQQASVVRGSIGVVARLEGSSRAQALQSLRELLEDARAWGENRAAVEGNRFRTFVEGASRHDLAALQPVVAGTMPLIVHVDRASDIEAVVRLADELAVSLVVLGGAEAHVHAALLAERKVPVVVSPMVYGAGSFDQIHGRADNAALLHAAGVRVLLFSEHNYNAPALRFAAGNAVRGGLPHEAALRAVTSAPGDTFGLGPRGRITAGAPADLVLWTGDPLEIGSFADRVWIDGVEQPLHTRQDALFERYRDLPGSPVPPPVLEGR